MGYTGAKKGEEVVMTQCFLQQISHTLSSPVATGVKTGELQCL